MACLLRARGAEFDVEAYLAGSPFAEASSYRGGDPTVGAGRRQTAGFTLAVGPARGGDLDSQVEQAVEFLDQHEDELRRLGRYPGVEEVELDFGIAWREGSSQTDLFPPELLWRAGALDIALRVTHYLTQQQES